LSAFHAAGYTKENLVDLIMAIGIITVTNLLHNVTEVPIDFPLAAEL
jgi:alkylhydroperoxidase family enzyme